MTQLERSPRMVRRRSRAREALMQAGEALFATQAVEAVSIDDIVTAADVAKGSFYNHFQDREELARAVAAELRSAAESVVAELNQHIADPAERVARALCIFVRLSRQQPESVRALLRLFAGAPAPDAPMNQGVRADIEAGLASGRFAQTTAEAGVLMALGLVRVAVMRVLEPDGMASPRSIAEEMAAGLLRALAVEAEAARALAQRAVAAVLE